MRPRLFPEARTSKFLNWCFAVSYDFRGGRDGTGLGWKLRGHEWRQSFIRSHQASSACQAGGQFIFWVADWFALMNDKMGGCLAAQRGDGYVTLPEKSASKRSSLVEIGHEPQTVGVRHAGTRVTQAPKQQWNPRKGVFG